MSAAPAVSVVMSVYDGERHLGEAIDSILTQTFTDLELVVVDDGSTDGTPALLAGYADERVRVLSPGRLGRAGALNRGLEAARAPLIALMDADDVSMPRRLEAQARFLEEHPDVGVVGTWFDAISEAGTPLYTKTTLLRDPDIRRRFLLGVPIAGATAMIRRDVFDRVGCFREEYVPSEDADLWRRAILEFPVANLPEVLYLYRIHSQSASHVHADRQERHRLAIVGDMWSRLDVPVYGIRDVRAARAFYAEQPSPLAPQLEAEYLAHEAALARAFLARRRLREALAILAALVGAPQHLPVAGRIVRGLRRLTARTGTA